MTSFAEFNTERPHEAIGMCYPTEIYRPSTRPYSGLTELYLPVPRQRQSS